MVGILARTRLSLVTFPSLSMGTLKSTRKKTLLPFMSI
jgi:hypothetical protein